MMTESSDLKHMICRKRSFKNALANLKTFWFNFTWTFWFNFTWISFKWNEFASV